MKTIFVSSTFKDMHYERDAIRDRVAPLLNEEARKYGDDLDFCDLRWGINTGDLDTEEGSKKVLDVCLDEIDRSEPPMVVLLGYRYGWIPDGNLIKTAADRKHLELEDLERSVTALEIEYGALCDKRKSQNTLFYFREIKGDAPSDYLAEDKEHAEKISALKNRIKSITGGKVKEYTLTWNGSGFDGIGDFARMLAEDIKAMLMPGWQETENLTAFQLEQRTHAAFIREKNAMFRARQAEAGKLVKDALTQPVTIIKGEVGSGKSTLFSHMATELEKTDWTVLPFISGLTTESNSARDIIENTVYFIEEELHLGHYIDGTDSQTSDAKSDIGYDIDNDKDESAPLPGRKEHTPEEWREKLAELCSAYAETGAKILIMVDAADQLAQGEERDRLHFIPMSVSENIHFVMTCTTDFNTPGRECYTLRKLDDGDKLDVINGILARNGREISIPVINEMVGLQASDNPLYLSLLVQRLLMMNREDFEDIRNRGDGMAAIEQYQLELIRNKCPDNLDEMSAALLSEAGQRINEKLVSKAAQYLAVSRNGLRRKDLAALLGGEWSEIDFSHFVNYMYDCFLLRDDGRYDFMHKSIRAGFRSRCQNLDGVNREILEYFKSLKANDPVRMGEIIYHAIAADDKEFFIDYVIKYEYHSHIISHAARDVYAQCMADNGRWMIDVLHKAKEYDADVKLGNLTCFCIYELYDAFDESLKELETSLSIMTANAGFSEHMHHQLKANISKKRLSYSYTKIAEIYEALGSRENLLHALELYEKALAIDEQLAVEPGDSRSIKNLSASYNSVAGIYEELGGRENLLRALDLYEKSLTIREELAAESGVSNKYDFSVSYARIAGIYEKLGSRENLLRALDLYEKALAIDEQLVAESGNPTRKNNLSISYGKVAEIYKKLGSRENLLHALVLYEKALAIDEQLAVELGDSLIRGNLSACYARVAGIYEALGSRENLLRALDLYGKSQTIYEQLASELDTSTSKGELSVSYARVAGIYEDLGGNDNLLRALELYGKSLEINEHLAVELGTSWSKENLSISYDNVGRIHETLGGRENLMYALDLYEKGLTIGKQLASELGTSNSKNDLSFRYSAVARVYGKLGGRENLMRALELHGKELTINKQLAEELGTSQSKMNLSFSYGRVAGIHEKLGGRENLMRALELYGETLAISEQQASKLGTTEVKRHLSVAYMKVAGIYEALDGNDNLKQAMELYGKAMAIGEHLVKELGTTKSIRELSNSYVKAAGIYGKLGGHDNLKRALELYEKSHAIRETLAKELGTAQSKSDLALSLEGLAGIYVKSGGNDNLAQALELYHQALALRESLADTLQTTDACDDLAACLLKTARHPSTSPADKKDLLTRGLELSKELYEKTDLDKYKSYIEECKELLGSF